jgi:hypothetical protein
MARRSRALLALLLALALCGSSAQFPKKEKVKAPVAKADIKCAASAKTRNATHVRSVSPDAARAGTSAAACARSWPRRWRATCASCARRRAQRCVRAAAMRRRRQRRLAHAPGLTRSFRCFRAAQLKEADVLEKIEKVRAAPRATRRHAHTAHAAPAARKEAPSFALFLIARCVLSLAPGVRPRGGGGVVDRAHRPGGEGQGAEAGGAGRAGQVRHGVPHRRESVRGALHSTRTHTHSAPRSRCTHCLALPARPAARRRAALRHAARLCACTHALAHAG